MNFALFANHIKMSRHFFFFLFLLSATFTQAQTVNDTIPLDPTYKSTLLVFEGSDWCGNCKRLKNNILQDSIFLHSLQKEQIKIELIDFPQRKKLSKETLEYNAAIAEKYDFQGIFPTLVLAGAYGDTYKIIYYNNENLAEFLALILAKQQTLLHE